MNKRLIWVAALLAGVFILALWIKETGFYTWHFAAIALIWGWLGTTFEDYWR